MRHKETGFINHVQYFEWLLVDLRGDERLSVYRTDRLGKTTGMSERDFMTIGPANHPTESNTFGAATLDLLQAAQDSGQTAVFSLVRHSARHYGQADNDLDNPLSEEGRELCRRFGQALPRWTTLTTSASSSGRCIETAELVASTHLSSPASTPALPKELAVFYVRDMRRVGAMMKHEGSPAVLQRWFNNDLSSDVMQPPAEAADRILRHIHEQLETPGSKGLHLGVTHDWTLYLLRQQWLGLGLATAPPVNYLDGMVIWRQGEHLYLSSPWAPVQQLD